ncbi:MAG: transcriptional regulator NrdR [Firmicutes bacterium]|jgi:transcriptional repressor NrdR|nr:transcriptional regulator NrdR [Bacillota bacterium]NLO66229.1 transcriptional regulator NrdR [Bacillota bacterium]
MRCPFCLHLDSKVLDSRQTEEGASIRRRRECMACHKRFTTYERLDEIPFMVIKKDGRREPFSRTKILNGMVRACEKRPISIETLEEAVSDIEGQVRSRLDREISSESIGELVMDKLRELDDVAYVRFASVYRQFKDIDRFIEELQQLRKDSERST